MMFNVIILMPGQTSFQMLSLDKTHSLILLNCFLLIPTLSGDFNGLDRFGCLHSIEWMLYIQNNLSPPFHPFHKFAKVYWHLSLVNTLPHVSLPNSDVILCPLCTSQKIRM